VSSCMSVDGVRFRDRRPELFRDERELRLAFLSLRLELAASSPPPPTGGTVSAVSIVLHTPQAHCYQPLVTCVDMQVAHGQGRTRNRHPI